MNEAGKGDAPRKNANQTAYAEGYDRIFSKKKYVHTDLTKKQFIDWNKIQELAVRCVNKWAVYVSNGLEDSKKDDIIWDFVLNEADKFFKDDSLKALECKCTLINGGLVFFDTQDQAREFYQIFNADLTYSSALYAQLHSPDGQCLDENT
jgi:hypothetical protein